MEFYRNAKAAKLPGTLSRNANTESQPWVEMSAKNAVIIGGSSGMGCGAARVFLSRGGRVLLCSRSEDKLRAARARLTGELLLSYPCKAGPLGTIAAFLVRESSRTFLLSSRIMPSRGRDAGRGGDYDSAGQHG